MKTPSDSSLSIVLLLFLILSLFLPSSSFTVDENANCELPPTEVSIDEVTVLLPVNIPQYDVGTSNIPCQEGAQVGMVAFLLKAHGGCFEFHNGDSNLISMIGAIGFECQWNGRSGWRGVWISPAVNATELGSRRSAWVWAEDFKTGKRVETEVFVDFIHRMEILTQTRRVHVGEVEALGVQAFDQHDNIFNSLEGLPMEWSFTGDNVIRRIPFLESNRDISVVQRALVARGLDTNLLPIKGIHTGRVTVNVKLLTSEVTSSINITVTEPLYLIPAHARIIVNSELEYRLQTRITDSLLHSRSAADIAEKESATEQNHRNKQYYRTISMPSLQYKWNNTNTKSILLNKEIGVVVGKQIGNDQITVYDVNIQEHKKTGVLHVVEPHSIHLYLHQTQSFPLPVQERIKCGEKRDTWFIHHKSTYVLHIVLKDIHNNIIDLTPNIEFDIVLNGVTIKTNNRFTVTDPSRPSFPVEIETLALGITTISVTLKPVYSKTLSQTYTPPSLSTTSIIHVTDIITLSQSKVTLPFIHNFIHDYTLSSRGGSGAYTYSSSRSDIANVHVHLGQISTSISTGFSVVSVMDTCNPQNVAAVSVNVFQPSNVAFLSNTIEAEVGSTLEEYIQVTASDSSKFDSCDKIPLTLNIVRGISFMQLTPSTELKCISTCPVQSTVSCWKVSFKAVVVGFQEIEVSSPPSYQSSRLLLSAFTPLSTTHPHVYLGVGSSMNIQVTHGPLPYPDPNINVEHIQLFTKTTDELYTLPSSTSTTTTLLLKSFDVKQGWKEDLRSLRQQSFIEYHSLSLTPSPYSLSPDFDQASSASSYLTLTQHDHTTFRVSCVDISPNPLLVEVAKSNTPSSIHELPVTEYTYVIVECYPPLRINPPVVTLGVGSERQVTLVTDVGVPHPLAHLAVFRVIDTTIASVNEKGKVYGRSLGHTSLHAMIVYENIPVDEDSGLYATAQVAVQFEDFIIKLSSARLLEGYYAIAHIEGINGEHPAEPSFEYVICEWYTTDTTITLLPPLAITSNTTAFSSSSPTSLVSGFSVGILGRRKGSYSISARIHIRYPHYDPHHHNNNPTTFKLYFEKTYTSMVIQHINPSQQEILLPFGGNYHLTLGVDSHPHLTHQLILPCPPSPSPIVSLDSRGVLHARLRTNNHTNDDEGDDAVVLVRGDNSPLSLTSVASVLVSVRRLAYLSVSPLSSSSSLLGPLCIGHEYTFSVRIHDVLGRPFDTLEGVELDDGASLLSSLTIQNTKPELIRVSKSASSMSSSGDGRGGEGVVGIITITALDDAIGRYRNDRISIIPPSHTGIVLKLSMLTNNNNNNNDIQPVYIHLHTANLNNCGEPVASRLSLRINYDFSMLTNNNAAKRDFENALRGDIARAAKVSERRIYIVSINPANGDVDILLLPAYIENNIHVSQWYTSYFMNNNSEIDNELRLSSEVKSLPIHLSERLNHDVHNEQTTLRTGTVTRYIDTIIGVRYTQISYTYYSSLMISSSEKSIWIDDAKTPSSLDACIPQVIVQPSAFESSSSNSGTSNEGASKSSEVVNDVIQISLPVYLLNPLFKFFLLVCFTFFVLFVLSYFLFLFSPPTNNNDSGFRLSSYFRWFRDNLLSSLSLSTSARIDPTVPSNTNVQSLSLANANYLSSNAGVAGGAATGYGDVSSTISGRNVSNVNRVFTTPANRRTMTPLRQTPNFALNNTLSFD